MIQSVQQMRIVMVIQSKYILIGPANKESYYTLLVGQPYLEHQEHLHREGGGA
jgi:hypothetical protein